MPENIEVERLIQALDKLVTMFKPERYIYLLGSIVGLLMSAYYVYFLLSTGKMTVANATMTLGGSGLVTMATFRTSLFFNKAFNLLEKFLLAQRNG